jgi:hypothetical protein
MNERIKLLKEQSMEWVPNMADPDTKIRLLNAEKFAELIVRECVQIAVFKDSGTVATADVAGYMAAGRSIAARLIKEHFGVEE